MDFLQRQPFWDQSETKWDRELAGWTTIIGKEF